MCARVSRSIYFEYISRGSQRSDPISVPKIELPWTAAINAIHSRTTSTIHKSDGRGLRAVSPLRAWRLRPPRNSRPETFLFHGGLQLSSLCTHMFAAFPLICARHATLRMHQSSSRSIYLRDPIPPLFFPPSPLSIELNCLLRSFITFVSLRGWENERIINPIILRVSFFLSFLNFVYRLRAIRSNFDEK